MPRQSTKVTLPCHTCGKPVVKFPCLVLANGRVYCNRICSSSRPSTIAGENRVCVYCQRTFFVKAYELTRTPGLFCTRSCAARHREGYAYAGEELPPLGVPGRKLTAEESFWLKVRKTEPCWLWIGATVKGGYGHFANDKVLRYAHCFSYELHHGPIPDGLVVMHDCPGGDNKRCVNPAHLKLGTSQDNSTDATVKGQFVRGKRKMADLTDNERLEIRRLCAERVLSHADIGRKFDVTSGIVYVASKRTINDLAVTTPPLPAPDET